MKEMLQGILASIVTFTRIPVPLPLPADRFQDATWHIPLIGWLNAGLVILIWRYLPGPLDFKLILMVLVPIIISGAMHEDGLADAADALFGGQTFEQRMRIMKDPHLGTFGVLTLVVFVLSYFLALKNIPKTAMLPAIAIALPLSRLQGPLLSALLPYVRPDADGSKAKAYLGKDARKIIWSFLWLIPLLWFISSPSLGFKLLGIFLVMSLGLGVFFRLKLGGITGDCLGAAIKLTEIALLWSFAASPTVSSTVNSFWDRL